MPAVSGTRANRLPVAGLVTGAGVGLRIGEGLRQERPVAETLLPLRRQQAQGRTHGLRGKVRRGSLLGQDQEAPVLHDELEALNAVVGTPPDPQVPVLECVAGRPPDQQRGWSAVDLDDLTQVVAHRATGPEVMVVGHLPVEPCVLPGCGDADANGRILLWIVGRRCLIGGLHPNPTRAETGSGV